MSPHQIVLIVILSAGAGALSGYYAARYAPVPAQLAIVDVKSIVMQATAAGAASPSETDAITKKIRSRTDALVQQGIIVLDADAVINAPEEAYVPIR